MISCTLYQLLLHISLRKLISNGTCKIQVMTTASFHVLALDLYIFNKRLRRLLEAVWSWECLSLLPGDPRAARAGREATSSWQFVTHTSCTSVEAHRCVAGLFRTEGCTLFITPQVSLGSEVSPNTRCFCSWPYSP